MTRPDEPAPSPSRDEPTGGDPSCWAHLLCPACGAVPDRRDADRCPRCGEPLPSEEHEAG